MPQELHEFLSNDFDLLVHEGPQPIKTLACLLHRLSLITGWRFCNTDEFSPKRSAQSFVEGAVLSLSS
jgi:hypothetical protein